MESYEQTYNTRCNYDSVGDWVAVKEALTRAERAARECWEDEDDVEEEVGIIIIPAGVCDAASGQGGGGADYLQPRPQSRVWRES